ncbi:MAG: hypothetical protein JNK37_11755 [Verrucomicrobiales bacterium]|nr:hypothetical protein [Verrucomicrobiales bacterium]
MNRESLSILPLVILLCGCWQKPQPTTTGSGAGESAVPSSVPAQSAQSADSNRERASDNDPVRLRAELQKLSAALTQQEKLAEAYRQHYWASLPGRFVGSIKIDGRIYENARIEQVTQAAVTIRHRDGMGTFPVASFPLYFQKQLLLSPPDDITMPVR